MSCLSITVYLLALISVPLGFIGLVVLINGFINKASKKINLGTILVCIALALLITSCFLTFNRCFKATKNCMHKRMCCKNMLERKCISNDSVDIITIIKKDSCKAKL